MYKSIFLLAFLFLGNSLRAQEISLPGHHAKKIDHAITLDGILDEEIWQEGNWAEDFYQFFPSDTSLAKAQTRVKIAYDDKFLYIAAIMYNLGPRESYVSTSLRRDFRGEQNDGISFVIDTFNDKTSAYQFGINPYGVMRESLIANGGMLASDLNLAWDNIWYGEAKIYDGYWISEIAIPFSTLRYQDGATNWNANFYRIDSEYNERSTWTPIPRNFNVIALAFSRKLYFEEPLKKIGSNLSLIPFTAARTSRNFITGNHESVTPSVGGDIKVGIGPALNLDLTVNPDFSQVEVDEQVTNLDRFEIFFPERRQFFLENADLFADFGTDRIRPFFSRRIGVARDATTGLNVQNQILYGARLSGKITDDWRIGMMNMQTASEAERGIEANNFSVAAIQKKVFSRSNIGAILVSKETSNPETMWLNKNNYNRLAGIDYNLASKDNRWTGKFFYHQTFEEQKLDDSGVYHGQINYNQVNFSARLGYSNVGSNYNPEVGFTPRNDYQRINSLVAYRFFPKSRIINRHGPALETEVLWNQQLGITDELHSMSYLVQFQSLSMLNVSVNNRFTYLFFPFDPTRTGGEPLDSGTDYRNSTVSLFYMSNPRNPFFVTARSEIGEYFTGSIAGLNGSMNYRVGYLANISMNFSYNKINLPEPQNNANLFLVGPRVDLTFTKSLFWTTFIQYNNQIDNINLNTRVQWRFAPVSDFFVVYTENYFPETFATKQRALVMKLTYWLNM